MARAGAPIGVLGPNTGLGVSGLIPCDRGHAALAGEGGHVTLGPAPGAHFVPEVRVHPLNDIYTHKAEIWMQEFTCKAGSRHGIFQWRRIRFPMWLVLVVNRRPRAVARSCSLPASVPMLAGRERGRLTSISVSIPPRQHKVIQSPSGRGLA